MSRLVIIFLVAFSVLLSSCTTLTGYRDAAILKAGYQRKDAAEQAIVTIRREYEAKLSDQDRRIVEAQERAVKSILDQMAFISGRLYRADFAFSLHLNPDRTHVVMDNNVREAQVVAGAPTVEDIMIANTEIKRQLNETLTSMEALRIEHEATLKTAAQEVEKAAQAERDLAAAKQAKTDLEAEKTRALNAKQSDLDKANNAVIAAEHERGDDTKARQALLTKLSIGAGLIGAACVMGAIFLPLVKWQFGLAGAAFGVAAVGIWYLTPLVILCIVGGAALLAALWAALSHHKEANVATDTYRALQRIKENEPDVYAASVKPELEEANMKYVTMNGVVTKEPDPKRAAFIDARLVQVGDK